MKSCYESAKNQSGAMELAVSITRTNGVAGAGHNLFDVAPRGYLQTMIQLVNWL